MPVVFYSPPVQAFPAGSIVHVVAPGDTLSGIGKMYNVRAAVIAKANNIKLQQVLLPGKRLIIPRAVPVRRLDIPLPRSAKWRYIIIHHSATERGSALMFLRAHLRRGFADLGYHFVINNGTMRKSDGQVEVSRRWLKQENGAHCKACGMNYRGIGVCIVGNFSKSAVSEKQMDTLVCLIRELCAKYRIPYNRVIGHRHARGARTECPGKHFPWKELRRRLRESS
jgi:N-acetyl-anhydromuramyl-L-alanine amidase AmpD